jgi:hypothetical protein
MEATSPFETPMVDLGPESNNLLENVEGGSSLEVKIALNGPQSEMWKEAMQIVMDALMCNHTWTLVQCPKNRNIVSGKWVLTQKKHTPDRVTRYKARIDASFSTSGIMFTLPSGAWRTKHQPYLALSSTKAEYIATALTPKGL